MIIIVKLKNNLLTIGLYIVFFIISCTHLFYFLQDSIPITSDYLFHLSRVDNIYKNIRSGIFLPGIDQSNMNGLGYLIDIYYPNLLYYIPALLRFVLPVNIALQVSIVLYNFICMIAYYKISYIIFNNRTFSISFSTIYMSSYYLFLDLVSAQAISEYFSILIFPLVIFGIYDLIENRKWKLLFISMTLIAYTHVLSLVLYSGVIIICLMLNYKKINKKTISGLVKAGIFSILVSSAFLFPFVYYIRKDHYMVSGNIRKIITIQNTVDIFQVLLFIFVFIVGIITYNLIISKTNINEFFIEIIILLIISIYIYSPLCNWEVLSFFYIFQFKKRIGLLINIFICLIVAWSIPKKHIISICTTLVFGFLFIETILGGMFGNEFYGEQVANIIRKDSFFITKDAKFSDKYCAIVFGEYIPYNLMLNDIDFSKYLEENNVIDIAKVVMDQKFYDIELFRKNGKYILNSNTPEMILDKIYYPVYNINQKGNKEIKIENCNGLVKITNINEGDFILSYGNTPFQLISLSITIITLIYVFIRKETLWQEKK